MAEDQPALRHAWRRGPRPVATDQGKDAAPEVRRVHDVDERVRLGAPRGRVEVGKGVREGVLLARKTLDEVAARDLAAVLHAEQGLAERGPVALGELARDDAVPGEQKARARLLVLLGRETVLVAKGAPPPDHRELAQHAAREPATAPPRGGRGVEPLRRRGPGDDRAERVRCHEPDPEEPPERRQNLGRPEAGAAREILGEGRTAGGPRGRWSGWR